MTMFQKLDWRMRDATQLLPKWPAVSIKSDASAFEFGQHLNSKCQRWGASVIHELPDITGEG